MSLRTLTFFSPPLLALFVMISAPVFTDKIRQLFSAETGCMVGDDSLRAADPRAPAEARPDLSRFHASNYQPLPVPQLALSQGEELWLLIPRLPSAARGGLRDNQALREGIAAIRGVPDGVYLKVVVYGARAEVVWEGRIYGDPRREDAIHALQRAPAGSRHWNLSLALSDLLALPDHPRKVLVIEGPASTQGITQPGGFERLGERLARHNVDLSLSVGGRPHTAALLRGAASF